MHAFWLVLTYDLLKDRRIDDVIIKTFFNSLLYKTNRFQVAVRLFSNRSQRTSKCGKNISDTLGCASCATFLFLPHFDVICDLLLNRHGNLKSICQVLACRHGSQSNDRKSIWCLKIHCLWYCATSMRGFFWTFQNLDTIWEQWKMQSLQVCHCSHCKFVNGVFETYNFTSICHNLTPVN